MVKLKWQKTCSCNKNGQCMLSFSVKYFNVMRININKIIKIKVKNINAYVKLFTTSDKISKLSGKSVYAVDVLGVKQ